MFPVLIYSVRRGRGKVVVLLLVVLNVRMFLDEICYMSNNYLVVFFCHGTFLIYILVFGDSLRKRFFSINGMEKTIEFCNCFAR